jgi:uncharacterized membrane protein
MKKRFSILNLMLLVLLIGVGLAALSAGSFLWLKLMYSLTFMSLLLATLAARSRASAFWFGFAVFGWGYFWTSIGLWTTWVSAPDVGGGAILQPRTNPMLPSGYFLDPLADYLSKHRRPAELATNSEQQDVVAHNALLQSYVNTQVITLGILHLLFVFVFGCIGGIVAGFFARRRHSLVQGDSDTHLGRAV